VVHPTSFFSDESEKSAVMFFPVSPGRPIHSEVLNQKFEMLTVPLQSIKQTIGQRLLGITVNVLPNEFVSLSRTVEAIIGLSLHCIETGAPSGIEYITIGSTLHLLGPCQLRCCPWQMWTTIWIKPCVAEMWC
jgi:hypothetical protein